VNCTKCGTPLGSRDGIRGKKGERFCDRDCARRYYNPPEPVLEKVGKDKSIQVRDIQVRDIQVLEGLVDIIILRFNTPEHDKKCVEGIIDHTRYPHYQITLFDNYPPRFPLSKIWNKLILASYGEYICLLNNDTVPGEGWLTKMVKVFERESNVGVVGPSTNQCHTPQRVEKYPEHYKVIDFEKVYGKHFQLSGFCLLFPKDIWRLAGRFDEHFGFYAQENEFLHRVQKLGLRTLWREDAFVWHAGEASGRKLQKEEGFDVDAERIKGNILYRDALRKDGIKD